MKQMTKLALGIAATAFGCSAQAQLPVSSYSQNTDQLLLGFTSGISSGDLVIDLGTAAQVGIGGSTSINLNNNNNVGRTPLQLSAQLTALFGGMGNLSFGIVGGHYANGGNNAIYSTVTHGSAAPSLGNVGTLTSAADAVGLTIDGSGSPKNQMIIDPTQGFGTSWSEQIDGATSLWNKNGTNPDSKTPSTFTSGSVVEDLYGKINGSENFLGTISLFADGNVVFTPVAVPEPGTYSLMSFLGLLAFAVHRRLIRNSA